MINTDHRHLSAERDPEGERLAKLLAVAYLDVRIEMARALLRLERNGAYHFSGCSSIAQYGTRLGIPAGETRMLVDLARALDVPADATSPAQALAPAAPGAPTVEDRVRSGQFPVENAAECGRILEQPGGFREGET